MVQVERADLGQVPAVEARGQCGRVEAGAVADRAGVVVEVFAVLGLLEFIDWGGGDILYYASKYLAGALDDPRYAPPNIIERNMAEGRIGMKTAQGFLNYEGVDLEAYREQRLAAFASLLRQSGLTRDPVV